MFIFLLRLSSGMVAAKGLEYGTQNGFGGSRRWQGIMVLRQGNKVAMPVS